MQKIKNNLIFEIFNLIKSQEIIKKSINKDDIINILFKSKFIYPIVEDFARFNKLSEKYEKNIKSNKIKF